MIIDGSYTFHAPPDLLWSLLHDQDAIRRAFPGCEHFHLHADGKYHISLNLQTGPFGGYYEGIMTRLAERPQESISLSMTGSGPEVVLSGEGTLTLEESNGHTLLLYEGNVEVSGKIAAESPRLTRTTANYLIRSFMEGLDAQIHQILGTAVDDRLPPGAVSRLERSTSTIGMEEFLAELRRDRLVAATVFLLLLISLLSVLGAVFIALLAARWLTRSLAGSSSQTINEKDNGELRLNAP